MEQVIMGQGEPPPDEWLWGEVGEEVQPTEEEVQP
jgi:hypothetical protein